jgi:transposase
MRWHGRRVAVYAYGVPTDMRKGFDGLCALVSQRLGRDPLSGDVFVFLSRDRVRTKVLHFDGTASVSMRSGSSADDSRRCGATGLVIPLP